MIETTINKVQYDCDGAETDFDFTFKIFNKTDIRVIIADTDGVETELTYITDFSVHAINNNFTSGGTVTTVATYSSEYTITIIREVELTQESDYVENESHPAAVYENDLDKLTMMVQQLEEKLNRALLVPVSDEAVSLEIPPIPSRTSRYAAYDAEGSPIAVTPLGGTVPVTAFMETLLDDTLASEARSTLDVYSQAEVDNDISVAVATAVAELTTNRSRVRAYQSTLQAIETDTKTKVLLQTEEFDNLDEFASSTFTATKAGYYIIQGQVVMAAMAASKVITAYIQKNGSDICEYYLQTGATAGLAAFAFTSCIKYLAIGDTIELFINHTHGSSRNTVAQAYTTYLEIYQLS